MTQPNIEERLSAAAYMILTDGQYRHSWEARRWAVRYLRRASHGRTTEFQRSLIVRSGRR